MLIEDRLDSLHSFQWFVIGAGPAGIATVGKLLDAEIPGDQIGWIDPYFQAGDLGRKWQNVPSNTPAAGFLRFFKEFPSFRFQECTEPFLIHRIEPDANCLLREVVLPLEWITKQLVSSVTAIQGTVQSLHFKDKKWEIRLKNSSIWSRNVVLCTGADPIQRPHSTISLDIALNPEKLAKVISAEDTVGVFGASHSAILVLANVLELQPKKIHHFYRSPHRYSHSPEKEGLRGVAAKWAKQNLDGELPKRLEQCLISDDKFQSKLAQCNQVIDAIGFRGRKIQNTEHLQHEKVIGILGPGLFGLGIGYPPLSFRTVGDQFLPAISMGAFQSQLNIVLPFWFAYANSAPYPNFPWLS